MKFKSIIRGVLFCMISLQASAQVDSMEIDGEYYKIYPYPENVIVNNDYWLAVKDKNYFSDPENYFQLFGETQALSRELFQTSNPEDLEYYNRWLKLKWKNLKSKDFRFGVGPRFVKQVRKHPEALVAPKYLFNKEVIPPFGAIPDGKYVQLFSEFCLVDKKGMCQPQINRIAGHFNIKNNSIDGDAVWLNIVGDTIKEGSFNEGQKDGEWKMLKIDAPQNYLYAFDTRAFRRTGTFNRIDTVVKIANFKNGILHGDYSQFWHSNKTLIKGQFTNGEESGNWKTYYDTVLIRNVTHASPNNAVLSRRPIIRTEVFLNSRDWKDNLDGYLYGRMELPINFYTIGFEEELDIELEEEGFKSHELEYNDGYQELDSPLRFRNSFSGNRTSALLSFVEDPETGIIASRGSFVNNVGAKMLYDGSYETFYPNGQLFLRYEFENGELVDEGTVYWDNGVAHDVIEFVADSNHYLRRAYDYDGVLYKTAIYDSLGDFLRIDEPAYVEPTLQIDGITAELESTPPYTLKPFEEFLIGNYVFENWEILDEKELTDDEIILHKRWSGFDTTVIGELKYNPVTRTMTDNNISYTGKERWKAERVFTEDFGSWTGKSTWKYGKFTVVTTASGILRDFENDTLPQVHLGRYYSDYVVTKDVEIQLNGEPYTGRVKMIKNAASFRSSQRKMILHSPKYGGGNKIERKLYGYFKKGKHKNDVTLDLVSSVADCDNVRSSIKQNLFGVTEDGYFSSISGANNGYYERKSYISGSITDIKGKVVEGKPQGTWTGKSGSGKVMSKISFDRGEPIGEHSRYAYHRRASKWTRERTDDSLPKRRTYYLHSTFEYDKGMLNGPYREYAWHGRIKEKGTFLDNYLEGEYFSRYSKAFSKSNYKNGMLDGYVQTYLTLPFEDTMLLYDLNFQHGLLNGKSLSYHTNGRVAKQGFFLDGEPIDDYEAYDTLGFRYHYVKFKYSLPVEEKIWEENELSLRYMFDWQDSIAFDPSDITSSTSLDNLMTKLGYNQSSLNSAYYGRPRLIDKTGLEYHMTKFYPNDTIAREGKINNGKKVGHWNFYNYEGEFLYEVNYSDSIITVNDSVMFRSKGVLTDYDDKGNKLFDAFIIEKLEKYDCAHTDHYEIRQLYTIWEANESVGRMNGFVQNFYDNGVLQNEGNMKNGLPDGLWKYYDPFGKLNLMGTFHQGKRHGRWLSGDLAKRKYLGEICLNPNLPDLEEEKSYRENLLDVTIITYQLGKAMNKQFYDLDLNKYSNLKND